MRVLLINAVCGTGSTGRICTDLANEFEQNGNEVKIAYGRSSYVPEQYQKYAVRIGSKPSLMLHVLETRLLDRHGLASRLATKRFLKWADEYNPDLLWLHNLHGYYINYELLFDWIKSRPNMEVRWTLHDCWAFTGHCAYFSAVGCSQWQSGCQTCVQKSGYPSSFLDACRRNFERKKAAFTKVRHLTIVVPSNWLADLVKKSFLKEYPIEVSYNKIDKTIFQPTPGNFRKRHSLEQKRIVLGVANNWNERKGLNDFLRLALMLDEHYQIVLVGLSQAQLKNLPSNVLGIERTNNPKELAEIYTAADVFVNPSKEETFGMTTVEALACGTTAIVYRGTACEEIANKYGGIVVDQNPSAVYQAILQMFSSPQSERDLF